ncbi:nucleotidyltransferase family protein [Candidatus Sumerlaeota bacterium]|nr:nucleotidyltransferase family protein [Candidatus Sumerlaeota bacterium]
MYEIFYALADDFREHQIKTLLIGGHSMQFYNHQRLTADTDWMICDEDLEMVITILNDKGYSCFDSKAGFSRFSHPATNAIDLDIMLVDRKSFEYMWDRGSEYHDQKISWRVPHPEDMIALKLYAIKNNPKREAKDLADIVEIARFSGDELTNEKLKDLCIKYGNVRLYMRLKELI